MHRFFLPPEPCAAPALRLTGAEAHHAARVLRVRPGEVVTVLDGRGGACLCEVAEVAKTSVELRVTRRMTSPRPPVLVHLFQALPKGKTWDVVLQKATELGVAALHPVLTERAVPQLDREQREAKRDRWQQEVIEACKQCGQAWFPQVSAPLTWPEALGRWADCELHLAGSLLPGADRVRHFFAGFHSQQGRRPASVGLWIGPEGDFSPAEIGGLIERGAHPITLGQLVLRVDTAVMAALALVNDEYPAALK
jgi:16S rRNA (uracil1498-N3)-methyltransferase